MRVLQVCPYDWHRPGGVQTHVRSLAEVLIARGHACEILAPGDRPATESGVHIISRPIAVPFNGTRAPVAPSPFVGRAIRERVAAFRPDVVHLHEPLAPSLSGWAGLHVPAPRVATFHAHLDTWYGPWLYRLGTWPMNRLVAAGIAVSSAALRCVGPGVRVPFTIIPNGVDAAFFACDPARVRASPRRLLFAHRLEPRKGLQVALDAFCRIADRAADVVLVVVGTGPDARLVEALPPHVRARVIVRGTVSREDLMAELREASLFLAPARHGESFGVVIAEALAAGVPVIASDVPGYRDTLARDPRFLVPPGDAVVLADRTTELLQSPALWNTLASRGRTLVAEFAWPAVAARIEQVYRDVL